MTLLAGRDTGQEPAPSINPEQGVIEEARRRRRARLLRWSAAASATTALLVLLALLTSGAHIGTQRPLRLPAEPPLIPAARLAASAPYGIAVRVTPNLEGAQAGWDVQIIQRNGMSGTSGPLATPENPIVSAGTGWNSGERSDTTVVVTAPNVALVRFAGGRTARTVHEPGLPNALRVAVLRSPRHAKLSSLRVLSVQSTSGETIHEGAIRGSGLPWRIWNPPAKPSPGACSLRATGGYATEWGQVAAAIRPYPAPIYGRAFLSCIDTEYFPPGCHSPGCGIRASVLLDAASPGRVAPASIPGLSRIPGLPRYANSAQNYGFEQLSARRVGDAWIVAEGGSEHGQAARIRLLRDLAVSIREH